VLLLKELFVVYRYFQTIYISDLTLPLPYNRQQATMPVLTIFNLSKWGECGVWTPLSQFLLARVMQ
jgi:hypothetical protein